MLPTSVKANSKTGIMQEWPSVGLLSFDRGVVRNISSVVFPTIGLVSLTVTGSNFGTANVLNQACILFRDTPCLLSKWMSDSSIGRKAPAGLPGQYGVAVQVLVVCGNVSSIAPPMFCTMSEIQNPVSILSYSAPQLQSISLQNSGSQRKGQLYYFCVGSGFWYLQRQLACFRGSCYEQICSLDFRYLNLIPHRWRNRNK